MGYERVVISRFGGAENLELVVEPNLPEPQRGEVRVRVLATSAAFTDVMVREGTYPGVRNKPPFSPGYDIVGEVDRLGAGVTGLQSGQRVAALTVTGGYAQYLCVPADGLAVIPADIATEEALCMLLTYVTAYQLLHRTAKLRRGQCILVHGAGGAVGTAMLQLGRELGLTIYGTASKGKHELVTALGGTPIDYRSEDWVARVLDEQPDGLDAVFDPIGGDSLRASRRLVRRGGILVGYGSYTAATGKGGSIARDFLRVQLWNLLPDGKAARFYSIAAWHRKHPDWFAADLATLFSLLARGSIKPVIGRRLPLRQARVAHELLETAQVQGKIVLLPWE